MVRRRWFWVERVAWDSGLIWWGFPALYSLRFIFLVSVLFAVTTVDSGKRALELLTLESSKLREIPVVVMSSENVPNRINRCLEEGAVDFLLKPVRPSDVSRLCSRMR
ncbi:hypothetical protein C4D60_Mb01t20680 [Musa balbisiana]|uniref:Response regulatory domain-containing protein n=1 Tax=Musa balbisiana TaxID=52838 RepID=A0A4S8JNN3_MUSBA|nr:hypothetical protein C4D60_Mb01t20680 [Musa balbisiana]